jgi:3-hydroxyisobutyrate dehydrogenase-like beta-hydroxyacid dehydrogenase
MKVGFIGLGHMGAAMAGSLLQAGHDLTVYNRTPSKAQGLIARQEYKPAGFAAPLGEKDIRLALAAAEALRVPMPLASLVHDRLQTVIARGGEELDWSAVGRLASTDAGLAG